MEEPPLLPQQSSSPSSPGRRESTSNGSDNKREEDSDAKSDREGVEVMLVTRTGAADAAARSGGSGGREECIMPAITRRVCVAPMARSLQARQQLLDSC